MAKEKVNNKAIAKVPDLFEIMGMIPQSLDEMSGVQDVAASVNQFQQGQRLEQLDRAVPGTVASFGKAQQQIDQMLSGTVPKDVQDRIQNNMAAQALGAGVAGSQMHGNRFARNLGLTSLDLINQGIGQLLNLTPVVAGTMTVNPMDITENIPNMTDLFNALYTQETNRANEFQTVRALNAAKEAASAGAGVGGGGGIGPGGAAGQYSAYRTMIKTDPTGAPIYGVVTPGYG